MTIMYNWNQTGKRKLRLIFNFKEYGAQARVRRRHRSRDDQKQPDGRNRTQGQSVTPLKITKTEGVNSTEERLRIQHKVIENIRKKQNRTHRAISNQKLKIMAITEGDEILKQGYAN